MSDNPTTPPVLLTMKQRDFDWIAEAIQTDGGRMAVGKEWFNDLVAEVRAQAADRLALSQALQQAREERETLHAALTRFANHPHCNYAHPANGEGPYGIGVSDGHRCVATEARAVLTALVTEEGQ